MAAASFAPAFSLETPAAHGDIILDWLEESQKSPRGFWTAMQQHLRGLGVRQAKSAPDTGTDLYFDLIARHLGSGNTALRCYTRSALAGVGRWEELSFEELHARCTYRAAWWAACGVGPGAIVAVALPFGTELVVSLLAGLRLGAIMSCLDPRGTDFLVARLTKMAPQHLVTDAVGARQLAAFADIILPADELAPLPDTYSHTFAPGEPCLQWFSPLGPAGPTAVAADVVVFGALRDGLACLALRPGDQLAAPGFHVLQHQPALLFAALITGAGYTHVSERDALGDPTLLDALPLRTIGITPAFRDAYGRVRRGKRPRWEHLVRNPEAPCDWEAWRKFIVDCELGEVPVSNLVMDTAAGGALLSSPRRPGQQALAYLQNVMPAPGRPWSLLDFTQSGQLAASDAGVYARLGEGAKPKPLEPRYLVLARRRSEYLYGGTLQIRRCGRLYPSDDVIAAVAPAPFLRGAAVVPMVSGGAASEARFVLVGFTGDEPDERFEAARAPRRAELLRLVAAALGEDALPDRVELFPLEARQLDGGADLEWIQAQYLGGVLFRKAQLPCFRHLAALRRAVRAAPPAPAAAELTNPAEGPWQ